MTESTRELLSRALALSTRERAELVAKLLESLEGPADEDVEEAWATEIQRRVERVQSGEAEFEDWEVVKQRVRG